MIESITITRAERRLRETKLEKEGKRRNEAGEVEGERLEANKERNIGEVHWEGESRGGE